MSQRRAIVALMPLLVLVGCGATDTTDAGSPSGTPAPTTGPVAPTVPTTEPSTQITTEPTAPRPTTEPSPGTGSNEGGSFLPTRVAGEFADSPSQLFTGTVVQHDDGCWLIDVNGEERVVAFPPDFDDDDPTAVVSPSGLTITDGTAVDVAGRIVPIADLPHGRNGRWGNIMAGCDPDGSEIARLDVVDAAYDPAAPDVADLVEQLRTAAFTESWPCGHRFAASTADQRIGIVVSRLTERGAAGAVTLPSDDWTAEIVVGKHLFVQNCDDAIEQWEPSPVVVHDPWPVTRGTFDVSATDESAGCDPNVAATELTGAVVSTPAGDVELGPVTLRNEAWGCFAG